MKKIKPIVKNFSSVSVDVRLTSTQQENFLFRHNFCQVTVPWEMMRFCNNRECHSTDTARVTDASGLETCVWTQVPHSAAAGPAMQRGDGAVSPRSPRGCLAGQLWEAPAHVFILNVTAGDADGGGTHRHIVSWAVPHLLWSQATGGLAQRHPDSYIWGGAQDLSL